MMINKKGVVAAGHPKTAWAAEMLLKEGGNACDAALAAIAAACVTEPVLASLGGGGFLLSRKSGGQATLFDFFTQTPISKLPEKQIDFYPVVADFGETKQPFHIGMGSIATPGLVKGICDIHKKRGSLPLHVILAPAIELAREGIVINHFQEYVFDVVKDIYNQNREARKIFCSSKNTNDLLREGEVFRNPDLAEVFEVLSKEGSRIFYEGELGKKLIEDIHSNGGQLTAEDLTAYKMKERKPISLSYRNSEVITNPPPSAGGMLIAFSLKLLEKTNIKNLQFGSSKHIEAVALAMKKTNEARKEAINKLGSTTHISIIDGKGNAARTTITNGEGSAYLIPGTGIMMNNMLGEADLHPNGFGTWKENTRISSMMAPSILVNEKELIAFGTGGSNRIRSAILQTILNVEDFEMSLAEAVDRERFHFEDGILHLEKGFSEQVIRRMESIFPSLVLWKGKNLFFGGVHSVRYDREKGFFEGVPDSRRAGFAVVV